MYSIGCHRQRSSPLRLQYRRCGQRLSQASGTGQTQKLHAKIQVHNTIKCFDFLVSQVCNVCVIIYFFHHRKTDCLRILKALSMVQIACTCSTHRGEIVIFSQHPLKPVTNPQEYTPYTTHHTPHTTHYTPYTTHHTLHTTHYTHTHTLHTIHYTPYTPHTTHYTPYTTHHTHTYTLHTTHHTPHTTHHTPHTTHHTPHTTHHTPHTTHYTVCKPLF